MPEIAASRTEFSGTAPVPDDEKNLVEGNSYISNTEPLTDVAPARTYTVYVKNISDLFIDVLADKGGSIVVTPQIDVDDAATLGAPSETALFVANTSARARYSDIASVKAEIVVTKTEGGDMTEYTLRVRGSVR